MILAPFALQVVSGPIHPTKVRVKWSSGSEEAQKKKKNLQDGGCMAAILDFLSE